MSRGAVRAWYLVHKWSSLICTLFMLMLCITGLPLIFHDEIDALTEDAAPLEGVASAQGGLPLDEMVKRAKAARPGEVPLFMAFSNDSPILTVTTGPRVDAPAEQMTIQLFNRTSGETLGAEAARGTDGVMAFLLRLHIDMLAGLPGMFFLGAMGFLFFVALVSGTVLYAPFMRKLRFGTLRTSRSKRLKWLDYHNLIGIVLLAWGTVVGLTGVINTLATPIMQNWQATELADMTAAYKDKPALALDRYGSLDAAMARARKALPGNNPQFIAFPGGSYSSKHHYAIFFQGSTPLTERLFTPALVDAESGELTDVRPMPLLNQSLSLSQPLHFGDYGGLPLKILWAVLDIFTIIVLISGLYLWLGKRRAPLDQRVREVETGGMAAPVTVE